MLVLKIWNYLCGYVVIKLEGLNLERILNLAVDKGIYLWDVRRVDYTTIEAKVRIKGYKELIKILKKTGCRGKIKVKVGYPFFISKLKRKKIIVVGLIACASLIIIYTSFIWDIEIKGNIDLTKHDILVSLEDMGIKLGTFKYNLNKSDIKDNLLFNNDTLAWVGVEIKGTKMKIEVVEKDRGPEKINKDTPCHIVAKKNGIVEKVIAKNGDALVKKGDIVKQNQVLISGKIEREEGLLRYVHSLGEVYARTFYEKTEKMSIYKTIKTKTGRKFTRRILKSSEASFTISKGKVPFEKYVIETKNKSLTKWRNIKIPVEIVIEEYFEVIEKKKKISEEVLKKSLNDYLKVNLIRDIPEEAKILKQKIDFKKEGYIIQGHLTVEVLELIGMEKGFEIHIEDEEE